MRSKKVWRYWCDYCGRGRCNKKSIVEHELYCTKNPNRICRMCQLHEDEQQPITTLLNTLPEPWRLTEDEGALVEEDIEPLRNACLGCPACMLAALRQRGFSYWHYESVFDYKKEIQAYWKEYNWEQDILREEDNARLHTP